MSRLSLLLLLLFAPAITSPGLPATESLVIPLLEGEKWWGGRVVDGPLMPFGAGETIERTLRSHVRGGANQSQPLLISSAGRYVWNEGPFDFAFRDGALVLTEGAEPWQTGREGTTLRDAFRAASKKFFPPSGRMPEPLMLAAPQYNTWIELLYDQTEENILRYAQRLIAEGYPPGVLMIDDNWQEDYGVWEFSARRFKNPRAMMDELHALGFKVMLWVCPFVSPDSETFRYLVKRDMLLLDPQKVQDVLWAGTRNKAGMVRWWNGVSAVLDLSNPTTVDWFNAQLDRLQRDYGIDGFKFDAGDSHFYVPEAGGSVLVSHAPRTPEEHTIDFARIGLKYPLNEYRACWKLAGQPLAQRLRDQDHSWEALQGLIPGIVAQGLMGYSFTCPDMIGGGLNSAFEDPAKFDPELVVRSAQVHALMPMMQFSVAPWRVLPADMAALCVEAARLHDRFGEHILALAKRSARDGEPIVRPLAWQWPGCGYEKIHDQFMLGEDILVAPVVEKGARQRTVTFPPGRWQGDDDSVVRGPSTQNIQVPLGRLPHYRKL
jgi:alpha-glucosidase